MVEFKRLERQIILKSLGAIIHKKSDIQFQFQDIYLIEITTTHKYWHYFLFPVELYNFPYSPFLM